MRQDVRTTSRFHLVPLLAALAAVVALGGCQQGEKARPDYNRPLPPGASALRLLLSPADWPDLEGPYRARDEHLAAALDRSIRWFDAPSTVEFFPLGDVTHTRARASVYAFRQLLEEAESAEAFREAIHEQFNCYTSVGFDDHGTVLYTGYYTPIFRASRTRTGEFQYPLYRKPPDLDIDPLTGRVHGRRTGDGAHAPYPTRRELESSGELEGLELAYVATRLDQYIIHVNGSARLEMAEGGTMHVGYAGTNGQEYTGLGETLLAEGAIEPERLGLPAIRDHFRDRSGDLEHYINMNDRFVFFQEYDGEDWPAGSLGVKVSDMRTLATDKDVFPRGGVVVVEAHVPGAEGGQRPFRQIMLDQDTGGAIRAAGRGDIYMGIGPEAERVAGRQFAEGRLYYFFLKHERVMEWLDRMRGDGRAVAASPGAPGPADGFRARAPNS